MGGGPLHALKISIHGQVAKGMVGHGGWWTVVTCSRDKKQWSREGLEKKGDISEKGRRQRGKKGGGDRISMGEREVHLSGRGVAEEGIT